MMGKLPQPFGVTITPRIISFHRSDIFLSRPLPIYVDTADQESRKVDGTIRVTVQLPMQLILSLYFASGAGAKLTKRLQL